MEKGETFVSHSEGVFLMTLFKNVTMCQNEVPLGKWHLCIWLQLQKQFSVLDHLTILIKMCMEKISKLAASMKLCFVAVTW